MIPYEIVVVILFVPVFVTLIAAFIYVRKREREELELQKKIRRYDHD